MTVKNGSNGFALLTEGEDPQAVIIARNIRRWHQEQAERARARIRAEHERLLGNMAACGQHFIGRGMETALNRL